MKKRFFYIFLAALVLTGCGEVDADKGNEDDGNAIIGGKEDFGDDREPHVPAPEINVLHYIHQSSFNRIRDVNERYSFMLLVASMQGLLNAAGDDAIYFQTTNDYGWLDEFKAVVSEVRIWNSHAELVENLLPKVKARGYVLMPDFRQENDTWFTDTNRENLSIAASYAAAYQTLILTESLARDPLFDGLECIADVRGKTMEDVFELFVSDDALFARDGIISAPQIPHRNVDLAISRRWVVVKSNDPALTGLFFSKIKPLSPRFSYSGPYNHEGRDVQCSSNYNLYALAAGWCSNISTHERVRSRNLDRAVNSKVHPIAPDRTNVHYVCILMSDGGNLEYFDTKFKTCFTHEHYGKFPLSFMMTPALKTYKPLVQDWYMEHIADNCSLVTSISGLGDIYPSSMTSDAARAEFGRRTAERMADEGQSYLAIMDRDAGETRKVKYDFFVKAATPVVQNIPGCKGVIFLGYALDYKGEAAWIGDVPMVSLRYSCVNDEDPSNAKSPRSIADAIHANMSDNPQALNPKSPDAYSIVLFNANPKYDSGQLAGDVIMENVNNFAGLLREHPDVEIVNASQFFELYNHNISH